MSKRFIKETINGVTLEEIQAAAFKNIKRAYWTGGYVYLSTADLQSIAWGATQAVYEMKDEYVKKHKNVCGLACKIAYNDMMDFIKKGDEPAEALKKASGKYGRVDDAVKFIDPRKE